MILRHRHALAALLVLQSLYFSPLVLQREVIFAHANDLELGEAVKDGTFASNRKFSDQSSAFIPEINQHLNGRNGAWLSTWNPHVQLGRPTAQLAGFGKAFLITRLLSFLTRNPFVLYTYLAVVTIYLTGLFCFLFLKSLGLHPVACFSGAAGLSLGVFFSYWLTFVMFLSSMCWTLALLWLVTEVIDRRSPAAVAGVSFAVCCLLVSGYPQFVILQGYLLVGFTLVRLSCIRERRESVRAAVLIAGAVIVGALAALPPYLDVAIAAQRSSRLNVADEFFLSVLPRLQDWKHVLLFLSQTFDAFWFGNPIREDHPVAFEGVSLTPFYGVLFLLSFTRGQWRQFWPWQLFCFCCLMPTLWPAAYLFMVHHLGFHLSRMLPLGGAIIPAFVLSAYSLDNLLRSKPTWSVTTVAIVVCPMLAVVLSVWMQDTAPSIGFAALSVFVVVGAMIVANAGRAEVAVLLTVVSAIGYGYSTMLKRPLSSIHTSSPLVEAIRQETADGSRYVKVGSNLDGLLPPNQEALLQIKSIGSYDSLASTNYQRLVLTISGSPTATYGRNFSSMALPIDPRQESFGYAGIGVFLSRDGLDERVFTRKAQVGGVNIYRATVPPVMKAQVTKFTRSSTGDAVTVDEALPEEASLNIEDVDIKDDVRRFRLTASNQETVLFVSEQFHPRWRAQSDGRPIQTTTINDFYLGAIVPPGTTDVELSFRPFVLWSWIGHVFFVGVAAGLLVRRAYSARILVASRRVQ
jgi:hypothetical protein